MAESSFSKFRNTAGRSGRAGIFQQSAPPLRLQKPGLDMTTPTPQGVPELLPCPFCGCAAGYVKHSAGMLGTQGFDKWDAAACKHCRATIGACDRRFRCREDARDAWNRRVASPPPPPAVGRQSVCFSQNSENETQDILTLKSAAQTVGRQPLTEEQIEDLRGEANRGYCIDREEYLKAFRDAEAAHGIRCLTCNGHGLVGGMTVEGGEGWPCPVCASPESVQGTEGWA